mmetsp:Transcript_7945/g.17919  ORF Transcript_7945/g.17919 Transcript_7945/m.17919 type:complete len:1329 (+) Transcript_7945:91-4077(+)
MMAQQSDSSTDALIPFRKWIVDEAKKQISARQFAGRGEKQHKQESILRKTTIAYGIAELLRHARDHPSMVHSPLSLGDQCSIDNFAVRTSGEELVATAELAGQNISQTTWNGIKGVDMVSPRRSVNIVEPLFLCSLFYDGSGDQEDQMGRYLEVEFPTLPGVNDTNTISAVSQSEEDARCHSLGVLVYELFSHLSPLQSEGLEGIRSSTKGVSPESEGKDVDTSQEPAHKKTRLLDSKAPRIAEIPSSAPVAEEGHETPREELPKAPYVPLIDLGFPSSICLLVQNLLECGEGNRPDEAYDSLEAVIKDLHLLLLDPSRFLFDHEPTPENGNIQLSFREEKLYGRENEVSSITDAFCRVSSGKSEAFFIKGFSGSGKSMLVNSLKARVDMAEGYVLIHKFDQMSKERPLLEVISVFNDLCPLIRERRSQQDLLVIVKNLMEVFGTDFSVLARLLPNIVSLSPQLKPTVDEKEGGDQMNLRSICFTLQRFMRVVSSKSHPVMLFLDDLQWCDNSALTVVERILSDVIGSSCLFFVGSYRSNEVQEDHAIFPLMDSLRSYGVPTTDLSLEGLNPEDLNTMVSDAMCMFPRTCEPLSDMVFQKTKGNPFFVLAFLRSLVDGGLLEYSIRKRRWVWDEDRISSMDITGNVLHLLSSKMSGLSENTQSALKVAACFGIKIKESVVGYLSTTSEYTNICNWLEQVVNEGFMIKAGTSDFKFVHDKVREAAYSLIPDGEKNQHHYSLGKSLYSMTKGKDVDDIIFSIADQINHGIDSLPLRSPESRVDLAKLNEMAGVKAVECSDYVTARSYLSIALSLLPTDHWKSHYDQSLRLSFLLAKSAYSRGDVMKAQGILQEILRECSCIEDKLPAYFLLVTILHTCGDVVDAYITCNEVLSQLGEEIPQSLDPKETTKMMEATSKMVECITDTDLLEMKEMDEKLSISLKFYNLMATVAYFAKPKMFNFIVCRMVQLTIKHGVCKYSIMGLVQYAAGVLNSAKDIQGASRIGNAAMSCWKKRFHRAEMLPNLYVVYYGLVAFYSKPLQNTIDMLRQGFDVGMSLGDSGTAFLNATQQVKNSIIAGENLPTLLKKVDYYLELTDLYKNELTKTYLLIFRDTISTLIDKGESTSSKSNSNDATVENAMNNAHCSKTMYFHRAIQAYWLGHSERCHHYIGKVLQMSNATEGLNGIVITYIHGLNSFQVLKRQNTSKLRLIPKNAIAALKTATSHSRWNFRNKVHLLEAENFSFQGNNEEAKASYAAAITSARCSRFVHEQGLACELAGHHYKKIGNHRSAWSFYDQAKQCYAEWGSQMKVDGITRQLESFRITMSAGKVMS